MSPDDNHGFIMYIFIIFIKILSLISVDIDTMRVDRGNEYIYLLYRGIVLIEIR